MRRLKLHGASFLVLGIFSLLAWGSAPPPSSTPTTTSIPSTPVGPSPKATALLKMQLDFKWTKEGFGNVMMATFTVQNQNDFAVKDIEITCVSSAPSGTTIDRNTRVIYERFESGKARRVSDFNMGFINSQAKSTSCSITDLVMIK